MGLLRTILVSVYLGLHDGDARKANPIFLYLEHPEQGMQMQHCRGMTTNEDSISVDGPEGGPSGHTQNRVVATVH